MLVARRISAFLHDRVAENGKPAIDFHCSHRRLMPLGALVLLQVVYTIVKDTLWKTFEKPLDITPIAHSLSGSTRPHRHVITPGSRSLYRLRGVTRIAYLAGVSEATDEQSLAMSGDSS